MFNSTGEAQVCASDGERVILYPRLSTDSLRRQINNAHNRALYIVAIALYNCSNSYVYEWRRTLQHGSWLGCDLEMARKPGEYKNTQHAILFPACERIYTLEQFETLLLGSG